MNWIKKKFYLPVSLILTMILVSACSSNSSVNSSADNGTTSNNAKPQKITAIIDTTFASYLQKVGAEFEKKYGVKVDYITTDYNNMHDKIVTSLASGSSDVDLVEVDTVWTSEFAKSGFLEPLTKYASADTKNQLVPISYNQRVLDGQLYAFPVSNEGKFLYYNEKMLKQAGYDAPPKTWDELISMAKTMKDKGIAKYGLVWGWSQAEGLICDYTNFLNTFHGKFQDSKGNWVFNQGGGLKALEFMVSMIKDKNLTDPSSTTLNDGTVLNTFASGGIPFMVNWSFGVNALKNNPDIKLALVPGEPGLSQSSTVTGGGAVGIAKTSKNKEWAWKFIDFMNQKRSDIVVNDYIGSLPVWKDMVNNPSLEAKYPQLGLMTKQFDYAMSRPNIAAYSDWSHILQVALTSALIGDKTPKQALDDAKKEIDSKNIK